MTDFKFPCPHCGKNLSANTSIIGRKGTCKFCSGIVVVPSPNIVGTVITSARQRAVGICPYCRAEIKGSDHIQICSLCKTPHHLDCWQENKGCTVYGCNNAPPDEEKITVREQDSTLYDSNSIFLYIPVSRLIIMSIISFGLYEAYWIYKNWRYLNDRDDLQIQPFWRGVFGIFYCHGILKSIHNDSVANKYEKAKFSAGGLTTGWIILRYLGYAFSRVNIIGGAIGLIIFPSYLFFVPVQNYINHVNSAKKPKPEYNSWSAGHILCLIIGLIYWLVVLITLSG